MAEFAYADNLERWQRLGEVFITIAKHMAIGRMICTAFCISPAYADDPDRARVRGFLSVLGPFDDEGVAARNLAEAYNPFTEEGT